MDMKDTDCNRKQKEVPHCNIQFKRPTSIKGIREILTVLVVRMSSYETFNRLSKPKILGFTRAARITVTKICTKGRNCGTVMPPPNAIFVYSMGAATTMASKNSVFSFPTLPHGIVG